MEIFVCVRSTLDWYDEAHVAANILPGFRSRFELWNETFEMSYAAFRARLSEIAQGNLARLEGATVADFEDVAGTDAWILPIDDDDWLAPDLPARIRRVLASAERAKDCAGLYWLREVVEPPRRRRRLKRVFRRHPGRWTCCTNNYLLRADLPDLGPLFRSHVKASELFDAEPERVPFLPRILAIQNRNLASQTALGWRLPEIDRDYLLDRYASYRRFYDGWRIRRQLRWAQPCIDGMARLMAELRPR